MAKSLLHTTLPIDGTGILPATHAQLGKVRQHYGSHGSDCSINHQKQVTFQSQPTQSVVQPAVNTGFPLLFGHSKPQVVDET